jgi:ribosomal-protein-alanine N-acetyltransferase
MTEALRVVLAYGFQKMRLNRIQAIIDSENGRSLKLVQRLRFKKEEVLRQRRYVNGQFLDDICFSLLRKEWAESLS